jgi:hypothetical protein
MVSIGYKSQTPRCFLQALKFFPWPPLLCVCVSSGLRGSYNSKPDLYPESLCISLKSGAVINVNSLRCVMKKFHRLTNDQIVLMSLGVFQMALSLVLPGLTPSGINLNPK